MAHTVKYFKFDGHVNNMPVFVEDANGAHPGVEWQDTNGNTFRSIVTNFYPDLMSRTFSIKVFKYIKANGRSTWSFDEEYGFISDDNRYLNALTGEDSSQGQANAIASAQFFIDNIGKNIHGVPLSMYYFFTREIIAKEGI